MVAEVGGVRKEEIYKTLKSRKFDLRLHFSWQGNLEGKIQPAKKSIKDFILFLDGVANFTQLDRDRLCPLLHGVLIFRRHIRGYDVNTQIIFVAGVKQRCYHP